MRLLVIGNFGFINNKLDGQTVKTRSIYELLNKKKQDSDKIEFVNTENLMRSPGRITNFLTSFWFCDKLILIPGRNSISYLFPFCYIFSLVLRFQIIHVAIGGWTDVFFEKNIIHRWIGKRIKAVLVENLHVKEALNNALGFTNVSVFPNFRNTFFVPEFNDSTPKLKLVYFSRIMMEKGIDTIFEIANAFKINHAAHKLSVDFWGQIEPKDEKYFFENVGKYDFMSYNGALLPQKIHETLNMYDLLILPTKYFTEGFPGAILDAYISGIPVLVSNWKHAKEFVKERESGFICKMGDTSMFVSRINELIDNPELLANLKKGAYSESKKYSAEMAYEILLSKIMQ